MIKKLISTLAVTTTLTAATAALADGPYLGLGLGYMKADSDAGGPSGLYGSGSSELKAPVIGLTAGYRWNLRTGFAAAEVNGVFSTGSDFKNTANGNTCPAPGATGAYYCSHKATIRLRGIYGMPIGNSWEIFGALGFGAMTGDGAISTSTVDRGVNVGVTVGLGAQRQIGQGKLRIEFVHDNFNSTKTKPTSSGGSIGYEPSYRANSIMASYIFSF